MPGEAVSDGTSPGRAIVCESTLVFHPNGMEIIQPSVAARPSRLRRVGVRKKHNPQIRT